MPCLCPRPRARKPWQCLEPNTWPRTWLVGKDRVRALYVRQCGAARSSVGATLWRKAWLTGTCLSCQTQHHAEIMILVSATKLPEYARPATLWWATGARAWRQGAMCIHHLRRRSCAFLSSYAPLSVRCEQCWAIQGTSPGPALCPTTVPHAQCPPAERRQDANANTPALSQRPRLFLRRQANHHNGCANCLGHSPSSNSRLTVHLSLPDLAVCLVGMHTVNHAYRV